MKRPPTEAVAKLMDEPLDNAYVHDINRDVNERYTVVAAGGVLRVFAADGTEVPVSAPGGWGYLEGVEDFSADLSMTTIADYTFVVNRTKVCALRQPDTTDPENPVYPPIPGEGEFIPPRRPGGSQQYERPEEV